MKATEELALGFSIMTRLGPQLDEVVWLLRHHATRAFRDLGAETVIIHVSYERPKGDEMYDHVRQAWPLTEKRIVDDLKVVCRDCDMTYGEFLERLAQIRKENPDYTESDFWCDHERDSCLGGA